MQLAGHRLHTLELEVAPTGEARLLLCGLHGRPACTLDQLLAAALPPGQAIALTVCCFERCELPVGRLGAGGGLAPLKDLSVLSCRGPHTEAALAELLRQAPRLTGLRLVDALGAALPACLRQRVGLHALLLCWNRRLQALPAGPYLAGELSWVAVLIAWRALMRACLVCSCFPSMQHAEGTTPFRPNSRRPSLSCRRPCCRPAGALPDGQRLQGTAALVGSGQCVDRPQPGQH